ncbi:MAG: ABC transporter ATP-binding protein [Cytophagales bacterium]|nr:ABC transporter ATP-binding protein [Armatimonadota bacterium]
MSEEPAPVIQTRSLSKVYRGSARPAVDALNLVVPAGHVFGFLGPNGAGKTTTIGMLLGNIFPSSGGGTVLGKPLGDRETRRHIGYLPEKFQFHDFLSASEFLDLHGRLYGMPAEKRRRRIPEVLELVGLGDRKKDRLRAFSKGMQQRAGLAQAILHEPSLVILDEPTSALDPLGRRSVRDLIVYLKERGTTVVLNSHLLSEVERTCDAIAIVRTGRIIRQGTVDQITAPTSTVNLELEQGSPPVAVLAAIARFGTAGPQSTETASFPVRITDLAAVPDLVAAVIAAGGRVRAVIPVRESLEDAFVRVMEET